jgi:hypothetical protein
VRLTSEKSVKFHHMGGKETGRTVGRGIFFTSDHGFRVEKAAIFASAHLVNDVRLEVDVKRPRNVLSG